MARSPSTKVTRGWSGTETARAVRASWGNMPNDFHGNPCFSVPEAVYENLLRKKNVNFCNFFHPTGLTGCGFLRPIKHITVISQDTTVTIT